MIYDNIRNLGSYCHSDPRFRRAFDYLAKTDFTTTEPGRYELEGDSLVAIPQTYSTHSREAGRFEAHREFVDIQFIARGSERILIGAVDPSRERVPYDPAKDIAFYDAEPLVSLAMNAGDFAVIFPHESHQPCVDAADDGIHGEVLKVVIKVRALV